MRICQSTSKTRQDKSVPFVNITSLRSWSIKRCQWKHKLDYYGVVFAHLATGCGIKAKDPSGLDSDRWIPHSRCCENPARAKALAGFSRHLSAGFTDLNPAPRVLSQQNQASITQPMCSPPIRGEIMKEEGLDAAKYVKYWQLLGGFWGYPSWSPLKRCWNWTRRNSFLLLIQWR